MTFISSVADVASKLGPIVRFQFDHRNRRLQVTTFHGHLPVLWKWGGDAWYYVPFLASKPDFADLMKLLAALANANLKIESTSDLGCTAILRNWPTRLHRPKTLLTYDQKHSQIKFTDPNPPDNVRKYPAKFLRHIDDFENLAMMLSRLSGLSMRKVLRPSADQPGHSVSQMQFI